MCGFSGLPKLRQLVSPSGSAPTQARLAAHSSTASTAPRYGSAATRRPLPSIETAIAGRARAPSGRTSSSSTAASACSGRRTVREPTIAVVLLERPAGARRGSRDAEQREQQRPPASRRRDQRARRRRVDRRAGSARLEVVDRALVDERGRPACRRRASSPSNTRSRRVSVTSPIAVALTSQRAQTASTSSTPLGLDDAQHPLLRLGDHDLERLHVRPRAAARGARRGRARRSPLAAISADEDVSPAAPRSCSATSSPRSSSSSEHSSSFFSSNGSPICTVGRLSASSSSSSARRQHRRAADPVAARCARRTARRRCRRRRRRCRISRSVLDQPDAHRVDEAVLLVRALEVDLAADRGDADRVAVVADARDRAARAGSASARERRARRSAASRGSRSAARRSRRRRAGCRRRRSPRPGTARPRSGGCATRP